MASLDHNELNSLAHEGCDSNFKCIIFKISLNRNVAWALTVKLLLAECNRKPLMMSQHYFKSSGNKSLPEPMFTQICHHIVSLGHDGLSNSQHFDVYDIKLGHHCGLFSVLCKAIIYTKVNSLRSGDAYKCLRTWSLLFQFFVFFCHMLNTQVLPEYCWLIVNLWMLGAKPLSEPMLENC